MSAAASPPSLDLVARDVHKAYAGHVAVAGLSFAVPAGEIAAMVGRTGCGKSTAMHLLIGSIAADRGEVRVGGRDPYREFEALRGRLATAFQTDRLLPWRTALENAAVGLEILGVARDERMRRARDWLDRMRLGPFADRLPHELSGGMRQRVSLARAFAVDPQVLFLDEAFSQLDEVTGEGLRRDFMALAQTYRKTCLLITHSIREAIAIGHRVFVMARPGRVVREIVLDSAVRADPARAALLHADISALIAQEDHPN